MVYPGNFRDLELSEFEIQASSTHDLDSNGGLTEWTIFL